MESWTIGFSKFRRSVNCQLRIIVTLGGLDGSHYHYAKACINECNWRPQRMNPIGCEDSCTLDNRTLRAGYACLHEGDRADADSWK